MSQEIRSNPSNRPHEHESQANSNPVSSNQPLTRLPSVMSQEIRSDPSNRPHEHESQANSNPVPSNQPLTHLLNMSQEIRSDPSNRPHEHESQANSNPVPSNQPLTHLLHVSKREKYLEIGLPLYEASIKCDWKAAKAILEKNADMELLRYSITENGETALHIAASAKGPKKVDEFVRNLVEKMKKEDLELVNNNQNTALYLAAAAGNIETVKIMMGKNPNLDTIPGAGGRWMPLYAAAVFGNKDVVRYLYDRSNDLGNDGWNRWNRGWLLEKCVETDMFDIAKEIAEKYPELGRNNNLLGILARKPEAFHEKKSLNTESNILRRTINSVSASSDALPLLRILWEDIVKHKVSMDDILTGPPDSIKSGFGRIHQTMQLKQLIFYHLDKLNEDTQTIITKTGTQAASKLRDRVFEYVRDMHFQTQSLIKQANTTDEDQALELQKLISENIVKLHDDTQREPLQLLLFGHGRIAKLISDHIKKMRYETDIIGTRSHSSRVMFIAAEVGNTNFLLELIRRSPDLIWKVNDNNQTIFHVAVKHRHQAIYNLLFEIGAMKDMVTPLKDKDDNNMLHLAAMSTKKKEP